ncbi:MAG: polyribonucleotide nucleotidyltransferase [bacterium]|nr:polyribonucleotide nucleotidyltransferase [bacterium]
MNLNRKQFKLEYAGRPLVFEVSDIAGQANASVMATYNESTVLATAVMSKRDKELGYFPLMVDFEERFYAVGKVLGSRFVRREGKSSEEAVLSGRVIDRTIRPLFDQRMRREVQVVITILSLNEEEDLDFLALNAASTALAISNIPWNGPVGGVKIVRKNGQLLINPKNSEILDGIEFASFVAGPKGRINMVELEGFETTEAQVAEGFAVGQTEIDKLIAFQNSIVKEIGQPKLEVKLAVDDPKLKEAVIDFTAGKFDEIIYLKDPISRDKQTEAIETELAAHLTAQGFEPAQIKGAHHIVEEIVAEIVHKNILEKGKRPDGRGITELRELYGEIGLLKRTHGSALFARGTTQSLAVATIAPPGQEQTIETMSFSGKRRFMLHYNFPQYSVGEVGPFRGPGRREIGHGALAEKALKNLFPTKEVFPYTVRVVSEILSSNGSSSMATVCAATLALMDAGVPIKKPAAGIAMGLMTRSTGEGDSEKIADYKVLTDLQGYEDHYGDMDFKVAGTKDGITAIQMDVKIKGLTVEMLTTALKQAADARYKILDLITGVIPAPRPEISPLAPLIMTLRVDPSQIGSIIGPGGKVINGIIDQTGCMAIDIDDDGLVFVSGKDKETTLAAYNAVAAIVKEYKIGEIVEGPVIKILEFGAIVDIGGGRDGMIHVSELKAGFVKKVEDVVKIGDIVKAKIIKAEPNGKIGLSLKGVE